MRWFGVSIMTATSLTGHAHERQHTITDGDAGDAPSGDALPLAKRQPQEDGLRYGRANDVYKD